MRVFLILAIVASLSCTPLYAQNIQGVRMLRLSEYSLAKLGVRISGEGVYYGEKLTEHHGKTAIQHNRKITLTKNAVKIKTATKKEIDQAPPFAPVFAVNVFKGGSAVYYSKAKDLHYNFDPKGALVTPEDSADSEWANQLVCVYVEFTPKSQKSNAEKNQVYLWYKATSDLLEYLPEDIAEPVWIEMFTHKRGLNDSPTGRFTDSWRDGNDMLTTKPIYPNPASSKAVLEFSLNNSTLLSIALFDIRGLKIKDIIINQEYLPGTANVPLTLNGLSDGMYLVVITPNNSTPVVQRIMVVQ